MHRRLLVCFVIALIFLSGCNPAKRAARFGSVEELQSFMTGAFDSRAQAMADSTYYEIALYMQPIWTARPGHWLYVEQSLYSRQEQPYRQRIYGLEAGKKRGEFISRVYELPEPEKYIGAYATPDIFANLKPGDLVERTGCAVMLRRDEGGIYRGSTNENDCISTLRGASYATTRVSISPSFVQSWDRGFDAAGEQVWGATEGGYMFFKQ